MTSEQDITAVEGVQSLYSGVNHHASWERSYNADGQVYTNAVHIRRDWHAFLQESQRQNRRRALMRCYISSDLLDQLTDIPIEAAVPMGREHLIWIGQNQHQAVALTRDVWNLPTSQSIALPAEYRLDREIGPNDISRLTALWGQFGWTPDAVQAFVQNNANGNPIALIRNMEQEAIGVMIAESAEFGTRRLVEITELAVDPSHRGHHLASVLIRELSRMSLERWAEALVFGEYNLTTRSYLSAARAGQIPGQTKLVQGVLRDHVGIETGDGNEVIEPWETRWLHNFLVMYQPNQRIR